MADNTMNSQKSNNQEDCFSIDKEKFYEDLDRFLKKKRVYNYVFTGMLHDGESVRYIGRMTPIDNRIASFMETFGNAGRMWQHARTCMKSYMDSFEK